MIEWFSVSILGYFIVMNLSYLLFFIVSYFGVVNYRKNTVLNNTDIVYRSKLTPPISLLVPAYNEEKTILKNVKAFLSDFNYPEYEVIVINDGSKDDTLSIVIEEFNCELYDLPYKKSLKTASIRGIYKSKYDSRLIVVDKRNGGKADALNAGINIAKYPYFGSIDADTILEPDSYLKVIMPIIDNPNEVIASGGIVGVINGSKIVENQVVEISFPKNVLAKFQVIEYLRAFLFGRFAWTVINALPIISGAFGLFKKDAVIRVGGYSSKSTKASTVGEDMEMIVRLHRYYLENNLKYRIVFVPDPLSWTQVPEDYKTLKNQRARWHRGLMETLVNNRDMIFNYKYKKIGLLALPYYFLFELMAPVVELSGYIMLPYFYFNGMVGKEVFFLFFIVSVLLGVVVSVLSVFLEIMTFRRYKKLRHVMMMIVYALFENLGYRQMTLFFRLLGFVQYFQKSESWGEMVRKDFET